MGRILRLIFGVCLILLASTAQAADAVKHERFALPGESDAVCLGGGGRFVIARVPSAGKLAVLDIEARRLSTVSIATEKCLFAASEQMLVVIDAQEGTIKRYQFPDLKPLPAEKLGIGEAVGTLLIGHATNGPMLLACGRERYSSSIHQSTLISMDLETLKVLGRHDQNMSPNSRNRMRVSANGETIAFWHVQTTASRFSWVMSRYGYEWHERVCGEDCVYVRPSANGQTIYSPRNTRKTEQFGEFKSLGEELPAYSYPIPDAASTPFYLKVQTRVFERSDQPPQPASFLLCAEGIIEPIATVEDAEIPMPFYQAKKYGDDRGLTTDDRFIFNSAAKVLIYIPTSNDALVVRPFDAAKLLETSKKDVLAVTSYPASTALALDKPWEYEVKAFSTRGNVKVRLAAAPEGVKLTGAKIQWTPTKTPAKGERRNGGNATIEAWVADDSGQEVLHVVNLLVGRTIDELRPKPKPETRQTPVAPPIILPGEKDVELAANQKRIDLPGKINNLCPIAGGQGLLLSIPEKNKLFLFDVKSLTVKGSIPIGADSLFAGNRGEAVVFEPTTQTLERFSYPELKSLGKHTLDIKVPPAAMLMGSHSTGRATFCVPQSTESAAVMNIDLATGKTTSMLPTPNLFKDLARAWISADGNTLCIKDKSSTVSRFLQWSGVEWQPRPSRASFPSPFSLPDVIGNLFIGNAIDRRDPRIPQFGQPFAGGAGFRVPALDAPCYLAIDPGPTGNVRRAPSPILKGWSFAIFALDQPKPITWFSKNAMTPPDFGGAETTGLQNDQRFLLVCEAGQMIHLPVGDNYILATGVDIKKVCQEAGNDLLIPMSFPALALTPGKPWSYEVKVFSTRGDVSIKLAQAPEGMELDKETLKWTPPVALKPQDGRPLVRLAITDASKKLITQEFDLLFPQSSFEDNRFVTPSKPDRRPKPETSKPEPTTRPETPSSAEEPVVVKALRTPLSGKADNVCLGGAERYLIFRLPAEAKLEVFDTQTRKIVGSVPLSSKECQFAANRQLLAVVDPTDFMVRRYAFPDLKPLPAERLEGVSKIKKVLMGHDSDGPLVIAHGHEPPSAIANFNPKTLEKECDTRLELNAHGLFYRPSHLRISAQGNALGGWCRESSPQGVYLFKFRGEGWKSYYGHGGQSYVIPNPNGDYHFYRETVQRSECLREVAIVGSHPATRYALPAASGPFWMQVYLREKKTDRAPGRISIHAYGQPRELATFDDVEMTVPLWEETFGRSDGIVTDQRFWLLPKAKSFIHLPESNDVVFVREMDPEAILKKANLPVLAVTSSPPTEVLEVGKPWQHELQIYATQGPVKVELVKGPEGMVVKGKTVEWTPAKYPGAPTQYADGTTQFGNVQVQLRITDRAQGDVPYSMPLNVRKPIELVNVDPSNPAPIPRSAYRSSRTLPTAQGDGPLARVDAKRQQIKLGAPRFFAGQPGKSALLKSGNELIELEADGINVKKSHRLPAKYTQIAARPDYFIAANTEKVDVIDRDSGAILRSAKLHQRVTSLVLHPTESVAYIAYATPGEMPPHRFKVFDEKEAQFTSDEQFIGTGLAMDAAADYLYSTVDVVFQKGTRFQVAPQRVYAVPELGTASLLLRFDLRAGNKPELVEVRGGIGNSAQGLRISPDGSEVVNVPEQLPGGYNVWNADRLEAEPRRYGRDGARPSSAAFCFHPTLPLAAAVTDNELRFYNTESTATTDKFGVIPPGDIIDFEIESISFSPDGQRLLVVEKNGRNFFLHQIELTLSPDDRKLLASGTPPARRLTALPAAERPGIGRFEALQGGLGEPSTSAQISKKYGNSVVLVRCGGGVGTGYVIGSDGYILTCDHCILRGKETTVSCAVNSKPNDRAQKTATAKVILTDAKLDLALLKIPVDTPLATVRLGTSITFSAGEQVTVIGNPGLGQSVLDNTLTTGVISNASRRIRDQSYVQMSAAVNPGSSGGPIFNERGLVIGTVSLKAKIEGAGFGIPPQTIVGFLSRAIDRNSLIGSSRYWVDQAETREFRAKLKSVNSTSIQLERESDGKLYTLERAKLSTGEQQFLEAFKEEGKP